MKFYLNKIFLFNKFVIFTAASGDAIASTTICTDDAESEDEGAEETSSWQPMKRDDDAKFQADFQEDPNEEFASIRKLKTFSSFN